MALAVLLPTATLALLIWLGVRRRWPQAIVLAAISIAVMVAPLFDWGDRLWGDITLAQNRAAYTAVIAQATTSPDRGVVLGQPYEIERRAPVRIYFQRAMLAPDHGGLVYDEADSLPLMDASSSIGIGGSQICIRLEQSLYRCWFA